MTRRRLWRRWSLSRHEVFQLVHEVVLHDVANRPLESAKSDNYTVALGSPYLECASSCVCGTVLHRCSSTAAAALAIRRAVAGVVKSSSAALLGSSSRLVWKSNVKKRASEETLSPVLLQYGRHSSVTGAQC